jgi:hypothetical protein
VCAFYSPLVTLMRVRRHRFSILERCMVTLSARSRPSAGRLPQFWLFDNSAKSNVRETLTREPTSGFDTVMANSLHVKHVAQLSKNGGRLGLPGRLRLSPLFHKTTGIQYPRVCPCKSFRNGNRLEWIPPPHTPRQIWRLVSAQADGLSRGEPQNGSTAIAWDVSPRSTVPFRNESQSDGTAE